MPRRPNPDHVPTTKQIQRADEFIAEVLHTGGPRALDLTSFVAESKPRPKKPRPTPQQQFERLLQEVNALKDSCQWKAFEPRHFVGLYCLLHKHVYGVIPEEVRLEYPQAVGAAGRLLRVQFGSSQEAMVEFMRWCWNREQSRLPTRDEADTFRIGWRYQFGARLVTDFRTMQLRRTRRSK